MDPIILNFHNSCLRKSDIHLLKPPNWLNDNIISFYFEYLEKIFFKDNKNLLFVPPEVTQCIKLSDNLALFLAPLDFHNKEFTFFALNDNTSSQAGGTHWSLLVFSRPEKKLFHFDSLESRNHDEAWELSVKLTKYCRELDGNVQFVEGICLQQENGYDCGIHLICNAENIAQHILEFKSVEGVGFVDKKGVRTKRKQILDLIQTLIDQGYV